MVELLSPCSDWATLKAAVSSGADAVYFGVKKLNMRANAKNFDVRELAKVVNYCHEHEVKAYLALNSIIYENELKKLDSLIKKVKSAEVDAVIIQDFALIPLLKKYKLNFHISTQQSVSNSSAVNEYAKLGVSRVILARECSLKDLRNIVKGSRIPVEVFVHGAMCVSLSGRCFLSGGLLGKSADRGECAQPCRREYKLVDEEEGVILEAGRFLNAKDLCALPFLDEIVKTGVACLKIEGRMKDANYVSTVTKVYREALDTWDSKRIPELMKRLESVFNRGFTSGFYYTTPGGESIDYYSEGSKAGFEKVCVGVVKNYYAKTGAAKVYLNHSGLKLGDEVIIEGKTTFLKQKLTSLQVDNKPVNKCVKGGFVALKVDSKVRENDVVYMLKKRFKR